VIALSYKLETYFFVCNFVKKYLFKKNFPRREILTRNKSKYAGFFLLLLLKVFFLLKFLLYFLLRNVFFFDHLETLLLNTGLIFVFIFAHFVRLNLSTLKGSFLEAEV
tara:strand:- start:3806 stop:4129 length:324 start_codon:yes stop_codon:yes gene_type:complete